MATFGAEGDQEVVLARVVDVVGSEGALEPTNGHMLAQHVISAEKLGRGIVIDFEGAGAISSGFANCLFLSLASHRPLEEWRRILRFQGLDSLGRLVVSRSLRAVRMAG